jgi:hypothetical protein
VRYLVGARYACLSCLRRGLRPDCARCGAQGEVVDLENEQGRRLFAMRHASAQLGTRARSPWDLRALASLPPGRAVLWIGARAAFALGFVGGLLLDWSRVLPSSGGLIELATRALLALVFGFAGVSAWFALVAVLVLSVVGAAGVLSQALATVAAVLGVLSRLAPRPLARWAARGWLRTTVAARRDVLHAALSGIERLFVERVRAEAALPPPRGPRLVGMVRDAPAAPIVAIAEDSGTLEVRDALVVPFELETADGGCVVVDVGTGVVDLAAAAEAGTAGELLVLPSWVDDAEARLARARVTRVGRGARVVVEGGEFRDEIDPASASAGFRALATRRVLRGHPDAPITLRVLGAPVSAV